jgi:hypothetical protein
MTLQPRRHAAAVSFLAALVAPLLVLAVASAQVVVPPIAPPKPAVVRNPNATNIGQGDLSEALNFAVQGKLSDATTSFKLFLDDWNAVKSEVRRQSATLATTVEDAIADVQDVVVADPPPATSAYVPLFRKLADVVEETNVQLGLLAPVTNAVQIPMPDLTQSVDWGRQGNLAKAHDEFDQFSDDWSLLKDAVHTLAPAGADAVDGARLRVSALISNPANLNPAQTEYYPALQALLQAVTDTNTLLAGGAPVAPAPTGVAMTIPSGDLDEAVDAAANDNQARARSEFAQFQAGWASVSGVVMKQQPDVAADVEDAIAHVSTIFGASTAAKVDYFPALQELQNVVVAANTKLAASVPPDEDAPPAAAGALKIPDGDLGEGVDAAAIGNVTRAKSELGQFQASWNDIKDDVRQRSAAAADRIDAASARALSELNEDPPTQSEYYAAMQTLQKAVADSNAQLGN